MAKKVKSTNEVQRGCANCEKKDKEIAALKQEITRWQERYSSRKGK